MGLTSKIQQFCENLSYDTSYPSTAVLASTLPAIAVSFEALKPSFQQIDRMEGLVNRVGQDMEVMGE